jgi:hypothetical protein
MDNLKVANHDPMLETIPRHKKLQDVKSSYSTKLLSTAAMAKDEDNDKQHGKNWSTLNF